MSEGEVFTFLISIVAAGFFWWRWIAVLARAAPGTSGVPILLSSLAAVFFILLAILLSLASHDVRDSALYIIFYIAMGYAVVGLGLSAPKLVGLQAWDIAQRNNHGAVILFLALTIANAFAFSGANIGDGPGFYVVLLCSLLSNGFLFASVIAHALLTRSMYRVLVDRDKLVAIRLAVLWVAIGLIAGRAVAGDWVSMSATTSDFILRAFAAFLLLLIDLAWAKLVDRKPDSALRSLQLAIAILYFVGATAYLVLLGVPK